MCTEENRYVRVGGEIMMGGRFYENPFYCSYKMSYVAGYMIKHDREVKNFIWNTLNKATSIKKKNLKSDLVDDCYDYILEYMETHKELDFKYHIKKDGRAKLKNYVYSMLHNIVLKYTNSKTFIRDIECLSLVVDPQYFPCTVNPVHIEGSIAEPEDIYIDYFRECFEYMWAVVETGIGREISPTLCYDLILGGIDNELVEVENLNEKDEKVTYSFSKKYYKTLVRQHKISEKEALILVDEVKHLVNIDELTIALKTLVPAVLNDRFNRSAVVGMKLDR